MKVQSGVLTAEMLALPAQNFSFHRSFQNSFIVLSLLYRKQSYEVCKTTFATAVPSLSPSHSHYVDFFQKFAKALDQPPHSWWGQTFASSTLIFFLQTHIRLEVGWGEKDHTIGLLKSPRGSIKEGTLWELNICHHFHLCLNQYTHGQGNDASRCHCPLKQDILPEPMALTLKFYTALYSLPIFQSSDSLLIVFKAKATTSPTGCHMLSQIALSAVDVDVSCTE